MILLDFSQVMIGSFMAMGRGSVVVEEDLLRHTVLNTIKNYKLQFKEAYDNSQSLQAEILTKRGSRHHRVLSRADTDTAHIPVLNHLN